MLSFFALLFAGEVVLPSGVGGGMGKGEAGRRKGIWGRLLGNGMGKARGREEEEEEEGYPRKSLGEWDKDIQLLILFLL